MGMRIVAAIKAGRGQQEVTAADWVELDRLYNLSAEAIYARLGVELPPQKDPPLKIITNLASPAIPSSDPAPTHVITPLP